MNSETKMPGLKALDISDTFMLREYLGKWPREHCDYTITNLIVWGKIYHNHYLIHKERLVVLNPKYQYILFPVGPYLSPKELKDLVLMFRPYYPEAQIILHDALPICTKSLRYLKTGIGLTMCTALKAWCS